MTAVLKLVPTEDDPVLAALRGAPFDDQPLTDEERAEFDQAVDDLRRGRVATVPEAEVLASIERVRQALEGRGPAWDEVTVGEALHWLDTGEASPRIASLLAGGA